MNVQQQILRHAIRGVDDAAKEHELSLTGEEVVLIAVWILNSGYGNQDSCPATRALGHIPRDPLHTQNLTVSQSSDPDFFKRFCVRVGALRSFLANRMKTRLERIANAQARVGSMGADGAISYKSGDSVDCYRVPTDKGLQGWRGPGTVVHVEKAKKEEEMGRSFQSP